MSDETIPLPVVLVTDGGVGRSVRWYRNVDEARSPFLAQPLVVSREGVFTVLALHMIPPAVLAVANAAFAELRTNPGADLSRLATHRRVHPFASELQPVGSES